MHNQITRRDFIKNTTLALLGICLTELITPKENKAEEKLEDIIKTKTYTIINEEHLQKLPKAVLYDSEHYSLKEAWAYSHLNIKDTYYNLTGLQAARRILNINSKNYPTAGTKTPKEVWDISHTAYLLAKKLSLIPNIDQPKNNPSLEYFSRGIHRFYIQEYTWALEEFSKGMFTAINLDKKDFEKIQSNNININYNPKINKKQNTLNLAEKFITLETKNKKVILNNIIWLKFKDTPATQNNPYNTLAPEYKMKSFYWNLGFFLFTEWEFSHFLKDKNIINNTLKLRNNKEELYSKLKEKFNYHTCSYKLVYNNIN